MVLEYTASTNHGGSSMDEGTDGGGTMPSRPSKNDLKSGELRSGDLEVMVGRPKQEQWNSEQIRDFVRKLGFMDTERQVGEKIKHFKHISSVS